LRRRVVLAPEQDAVGEAFFLVRQVAELVIDDIARGWPGEGGRRPYSGGTLSGAVDTVRNSSGVTRPSPARSRSVPQAPSARVEAARVRTATLRMRMKRLSLCRRPWKGAKMGVVKSG
jgi:hypothetical protein